MENSTYCVTHARGPSQFRDVRFFVERSFQWSSIQEVTLCVMRYMWRLFRLKDGFRDDLRFE